MKELIKIYNQLNDITNKSQLLRLQSNLVNLKQTISIISPYI